MKRAVAVVGICAGLSAAGFAASLLSTADDSEKQGRTPRERVETSTDPKRPPTTLAAERAAMQQRALEAALELDPVRPARPPDPDHVPPRVLPHPEPPPDTARIKAEAWTRAVAAHSQRPGETAFRAIVQAFMQHNRRFAEVHAAREGLGLDEVEELTHFGLLVQETQRWPEVEKLVGRDLGEEVRSRAQSLMFDLNREFKAQMRELVAQGASVAERQRFISATRGRYLNAYFALTGMNEELLDQLLAGDAARAYAPSTTPPVEGAAERDEDPDTLPERPQSPPKD